MLWGRRNPFVAAENVGDLHMLIVDNRSKVVSGETVGFYNDEIFDNIGGKFNRSMDNIVPF